MKISAIVAEYNPFHNGHLYQLQKTKALSNCDFVIAVMSGNFAQRGIPCCTDKYTRTKMALASGIDMILELPFPFATASAERFCEGAVSILNKTNLVDTISFGSELGELKLLEQAASLLMNEPLEVSEAIQNDLRKGISYPRARVSALSNYLHTHLDSPHDAASIANILSTPNNILGIHYIKALLYYRSPITPLTIKRKTAAYHDDTIRTTIASATAIRKHLTLQNPQAIHQAMPPRSHDLFMESFKKNGVLPQLDDYSEFLQYKLSFSELRHFYALWDIPGDLLNSLLHAHKQHFKISEIIACVCSKTYTKSTVQRAILRILLEVDTLTLNALHSIDWIPYIRVLGCKKSAIPLLSELTQSSSVPIITNLGRQYGDLDPLAQKLINIELAATKLYYLGARTPQYCNQDMTAPFIVLP